MGTRVGVPYLALEGLRILLASRDDPFCADYVNAWLRTLHDDIRELSINAFEHKERSWFSAEVDAIKPNRSLVPVLKQDPSDPRSYLEDHSLQNLRHTRIDFPGLYHFLGYLCGFEAMGSHNPGQLHRCCRRRRNYRRGLHEAVLSGIEAFRYSHANASDVNRILELATMDSSCEKFVRATKFMQEELRKLCELGTGKREQCEWRQLGREEDDQLFGYSDGRILLIRYGEHATVTSIHAFAEFAENVAMLCGADLIPCLVWPRNDLAKKFDDLMESTIKEILMEAAFQPDTLACVLIARRLHQAWYASFAFLDDPLKQGMQPDLLKIETKISYNQPSMVGEKNFVDADYTRLEQVREQYPLTASETYAKLYHILPGVPYYPVACARQEEGLQVNDCEDMSAEEIRQLSWLKLSLVSDHLGLSCVRSCNSDIARKRRAQRGSIFAQWDVANRGEPDVEMDYAYEEEVRSKIGTTFSIAELRILGVKLAMAIDKRISR